MDGAQGQVCDIIYFLNYNGNLPVCYCISCWRLMVFTLECLVWEFRTVLRNKNGNVINIYNKTQVSNFCY